MNYLNTANSEPNLYLINKEEGLKIQVSLTKEKLYYDNLKKQFLEYDSNDVYIAETKTQELVLYSKLLEGVALLIEKTTENIQSSIQHLSQGISRKVNEGVDSASRSWLKHIYALESCNLNPCLKIRKDTENKIEELFLELEVETIKSNAEENVQHHLKTLIPMLDTIIVDFYKEEYEPKDGDSCELGVRSTHFTKKSKGKLAVTCSKFLYNRIGNKMLSVVPVVHGKSYIQKGDKLNLAVTEFLTYKRFSYKDEDVLSAISKAIESYESKWNIDLEETIKQDRVVLKSTAVAK